MAHESSTIFIKKPPFTEIDSESFLYTKEILNGRIFLGQYEERRYVPSIKAYRDLVIIHPEEQELQHDLIKILKKWLGKPGIKWLGITCPDDENSPSYCFWVKLTNLPFGCYWFQIKHVKLIDEEVIVNLKCIRKFQTMEVSRTSSLRKNLVYGGQDNFDSNPSDKISASIESWDFDPKRIKTICTEAVENVLPYLTWRNCVTAAKVISAFLIVLLVGLFSLISHAGEFLLKLIRELSNLVRALTPFLIHVIDFCSKIVGGLYLLLYGIFTKSPRPPAPPYNSFNYYSLEPKAENSGVLSLDWRKRNQMLRQELLTDGYKSK